MTTDYETLRGRLRIVGGMGAAFVACGLLQMALGGWGDSLFGALAVGLALGLLSTVGLYLPWRRLWHVMAGWSGEEAAREAWSHKDATDRYHEGTWRAWAAGPIGGGALILGFRVAFGEDGGWVAVWGWAAGLFIGVWTLWQWLLWRARAHREQGRR